VAHVVDTEEEGTRKQSISNYCIRSSSHKHFKSHSGGTDCCCSSHSLC